MSTVLAHTLSLAVRAWTTWLIMYSPFSGAAEGCSDSTREGRIQLTEGRVSFCTSDTNSFGHTGRKDFS